MKIFHDITSWIETRNHRDPKQTLGFVPTMGNLHQGHLSLVEHSRKDNTHTLASLFVNPTQFNQPEDFKNYPRTLEQDLSLLEQAGVDYCLVPSFESMYPDQYTYQIEETKHSQCLEGQSRPGHYTGVLTIVMKLLQLAKPTRAYFGEKDHQQYQLIREMTKAFFMDIDIRLCPTIREPSGLAYSSRNNRLSPSAKEKAILFANIFHATPSCDEIQIKLKQAGIEIDYIEDHEGRRFAAVIIDGIRLIDNYTLNQYAQSILAVEAK